MSRIFFLVFGILCLAPACSSAGTPPTPPPVSSYAECVAAGGIILKSYPPQCAYADGKRFVQERKPRAHGPCVDFCGDGECQEMVCQAVGCPCAETEINCPADCSPQSVR